MVSSLTRISPCGSLFRLSLGITEGSVKASDDHIVKLTTDLGTLSSQPPPRRHHAKAQEARFVTIVYLIPLVHVFCLLLFLHLQLLRLMVLCKLKLRLAKAQSAFNLEELRSVKFHSQVKLPFTFLLEYFCCVG